MTPTISILIPTLECRAQYLVDILQQLNEQRTKSIDVITLLDDGDTCTGEKRNRLIEMAKEKGSRYIAFVDDDDRISDDYCRSILDALRFKPDVVGFRMKRYHDGREIGEEVMSLRNEEYEQQRDENDYISFNYPPTHLCPVRTDLAAREKFKKMNLGEDSEWQVRMFCHLRTEIYVNRVLYHYYFRTEKGKERTNFLRTWRP